ncbi:MAG: SAM-dependent DNA methyltransferase [Leptospiraceae bacterium]|nr:SAM-dependent DNA methyltransferase [Leptospiraceae bacterium]
MTNHDLENFIWQIADLLRGPYRPPQYERVMLPMVVLRRLDCVLGPTKGKVLKAYEKHQNKSGKILDSLLNKAAGEKFHNHSEFDFETLKGDPDKIAEHLGAYITGFSANIRKIFEYFDFAKEIETMSDSNILYLVVSKFSEIDLHPNKVDNSKMGSIFENLIRRFNEQANETAGDHFTPREVIRLMVALLFSPDDKSFKPNAVSTILDPACGTGGMLAEAQNYMQEHNPDAELFVYGQDYNKRSYAVAASDLLIKDFGNSEIKFGDSLIDDQFFEQTFDYLIANPPFCVDWKKQKPQIEKLNKKLGSKSPYRAGLPRVNDGALLFIQHMISKFQPVEPEKLKYGSRLAIVFNGSPLFTGGAGQGESEIRKWIIENDWLEVIIALPEQMFYNTGIGTYIWIVTNRKGKHRKKKIQLIDAREKYEPLRRSLGAKRRELSEEQIKEIILEHGKFEESKISKIFDNSDFGYTRVTVERPLRLRFHSTIDRKDYFLEVLPHLLHDVQEIEKKVGKEPVLDWNYVKEEAEKVLKERESRWSSKEWKFYQDVFTETDENAKPVILKKRKHTGKNEELYGWYAIDKKTEVQYEVDTKLRDNENIPLKEDIAHYMQTEVLPHVPDAWIDSEKTKIGYEINFNRYFYEYIPPRPVKEIDKDLQKVEKEIYALLNEVVE